MIDAYDTLGVGLDATKEEIEKAHKKLVLQHHPDKQQGGGSDSSESFIKIQWAKTLLVDAERKKLYDTFGVDLGEEQAPEMEVWTIGMSSVLQPIGAFALKTVLARFAVWFVSWTWIGRLLLLGGVVVGVLCFLDVRIQEVRVREPDVFIPVAVIDVIVLVAWMSPWLTDTVIVFYLVSEIVGASVFLENWKVGAAGGAASFFLCLASRGLVVVDRGHGGRGLRGHARRADRRHRHHTPVARQRAAEPGGEAQVVAPEHEEREATSTG